jgi:membrane protein involved in colicin uptake
MKTVKITKRENYTNIINVLTEIGGHEDLVAFAEAEIVLLDKKAAKAAEKKAKADAKAAAKAEKEAAKAE